MRFAARTILLISAMSLMTLPALAMEAIEDHMDMEGPFIDGPAVTAACLECHEEVADHFMKTSHWNWAPVQDVIGKGKIPLGKKNTLNNFCIGVSSNWARCTSCHAGYGWKDASFDFNNPEKTLMLMARVRGMAARETSLSLATRAAWAGVFLNPPSSFKFQIR